MPQPRRLHLVGVLLVALSSAVPASAQNNDPGAVLRDDRIRIGLTLGGTGFVGVVGEYQRNDWSAELVLGTISFREVSVALSGKRYFSSGNLRPAVGLGLWSLSAWTEDGSGSVLLLRAPVAADWRFSNEHAMGVEVGFNRGLAVNRLDPEDDTPVNTSIVPFPGAYYRYGWSP